MPDARILVTGSRSWSNPELLADTLLDTWHDATHLVVGFPQGPATGTRDCMRRAEKAGLTVRAIAASPAAVLRP